MAVQALVCAYGHLDVQNEKDLLWLALSTVTNGFLDEQEERGGMVGNIYSMGLVMQVRAGGCNTMAAALWPPCPLPGLLAPPLTSSTGAGNRGQVLLPTGVGL